MELMGNIGEYVVFGALIAMPPRNSRHVGGKSWNGSLPRQRRVGVLRMSACEDIVFFLGLLYN